MSVEDLHLNLRNLQESDYPQLKRLMDGIYDDIGGAWPEHTINRLIAEFPDGQIVIEDGDRLVGVALTALVDVTLAVDESVPCMDPDCGVEGCVAGKVRA